MPESEPLSNAEVASAVSYTLKRYNERSIRFIQFWAGTEPDGKFEHLSAQAVARAQDAGGLELVDGKLGPITLDHLIQTLDLSDGKSLKAAYMMAGAVAVTSDLFDIDLSDVLSIRFNPTLKSAVVTSFEAGSERVVHLGAAAFEGRDALITAIGGGLAATAPTTELSENEDLLPKVKEAAAISHDKKALGDPRSVRIVQGLLGTTPDGIFGPQTVERIASLQARESREPTGRLDLETMELLHNRLRQAKQLDSALRLIVDFFGLDDSGTLEMSVDDDTRFATSGGIGAAITIAPETGPSVSVLRFRSSTVDDDLASAAATVTHELEHARQNWQGETWSTSRKEFYGHSAPLLHAGLPSIGMLELLPETSRLLGLWHDMTVEEQREVWPRFERVRTVVLDLCTGFLGEPDIEQGQRELLQERIDGFNEVTEP